MSTNKIKFEDGKDVYQADLIVHHCSDIFWIAIAHLVLGTCHSVVITIILIILIMPNPSLYLQNDFLLIIVNDMLTEAWISLGTMQFNINFFRLVHCVCRSKLEKNCWK